MASKYRPAIENMHGLPLLKHPLELKFKGKSSSPNTLNASGGAIDNRAQQKANFPRVDRNIGSLPLDGGHHHSRTQNSPQGKHVEKKKKQVGHGRSNAKSGDSLPIVAKASGPQEDGKPSSTKDQRVRTRRRHDIILSRPATIAVVVKYQLGQHELKKFKACFKQIDLNSSGVIDCDEFFEFIDETKTPFSESLFRMIDADSNGTIDFEEFVHATVLYCMYTRDEILHFAFDTFDTAATGSIGDKDLRRLVSMVNDGQSKFSKNINNGLSDFDHNKDGVIDFEEFRNMNKRFPMLLFPCFRLQDRMQKATLGDGHWLQLHKRFYERLKMEHYQVQADLMAYPLFVSLL